MRINCVLDTMLHQTRLFLLNTTITKKLCNIALRHHIGQTDYFDNDLFSHIKNLTPR